MFHNWKLLICVRWPYCLLLTQVKKKFGSFFLIMIFSKNRKIARKTLLGKLPVESKYHSQTERFHRIDYWSYNILTHAIWKVFRWHFEIFRDYGHNTNIAVFMLIFVIIRNSWSPEIWRKPTNEIIRNHVIIFSNKRR